MKRLILKADYGQDFTHNRLPKLLLRLVVSELNKRSNIRVLTYIRDNYKLNKSEIIMLLRNNLRVSIYVDKVIICFNNVKIREELDDMGNVINVLYLETIIDFINYGNRECRGTNAINNVISYLQNHIPTLYKLYVMRGSSTIWQ